MRRSRKKSAAAILPVLVVASLLSVVTAASSPASGDGGVDLSSDAAIVQYLRSIGVDLVDVVWQRGFRNYAGPNCPGPGWNCVRANRPVVQITTPLGTNQYHCTGPECIAVQSERDDDDDDDDGDDEDDGDKNVATCEAHSSGSSNVLQVCMLAQDSTGHTTNAASIKMTIKQSSGARNSTQTARQVARITQLNTAGKNVASIWQSITQSQNASGGMTISQTQEAHQGASVDQGTTSGDNVSDIEQWQNQSQRAERATVSITQRQNTAAVGDEICDGANGTPDYDQRKNQCVDVIQTSSPLPSVGGKNVSDLESQIRENQFASKSPTVDQDQGEMGRRTGQDGSVEQLSSAPADSEAFQNTLQVQKASYVPALGLSQFKDAGDPRCCQFQMDNEANRAKITQKTNQFASSPGAIQQAIFVGDCFTSGTCTVFQSATVNGETDTNSCTGMVCFEVFVCQSPSEGSPCFVDEGGSGG
jgi:hypothetical protein